MERTLAPLDLTYTKRWVIAPTYREQSVAEHSFRVAVLADFILGRCLALDRVNYEGVNREALLADALYHDCDEVFSGDCPGPDKDEKSASPLPDTSTWHRYHRIVKVADSLETASWWHLWGNSAAWNHPYNKSGAKPGSRDWRKIVHFCKGYPAILEAACDAWNHVTSANAAPYRQPHFLTPHSAKEMYGTR